MKNTTKDRKSRGKRSKAKKKPRKRNLTQEEEDKDNLSVTEENVWEPVDTNDCFLSTVTVSETGQTSGEMQGGWEEYWKKYGEELVWHGWVEKYRNYIEPAYLSKQNSSTKTILCNEENGEESDETFLASKVRNIQVFETNRNIHIDSCKKIADSDDDNDSNENVISEKIGALSNPVVVEAAQMEQNNVFSHTNSCEEQITQNPFQEQETRVKNITNPCKLDNSSNNENLNQNYMTMSDSPSHTAKAPFTMIGNDISDTNILEESSANDWNQLWQEHLNETHWFYYRQYYSWFGEKLDSQEYSNHSLDSPALVAKESEMNCVITQPFASSSDYYSILINSDLTNACINLTKDIQLIGEGSSSVQSLSKCKCNNSYVERFESNILPEGMGEDGNEGILTENPKDAGEKNGGKQSSSKDTSLKEKSPSDSPRCNREVSGSKDNTTGHGCDGDGDDDPPEERRIQFKRR